MFIGQYVKDYAKLNARIEVFVLAAQYDKFTISSKVGDFFLFFLLF